MGKILFVLAVGLICEAAGVVLLKEGIDSISKGKVITVANILPILVKGAVNARIIMGVALEAVFFACLLYLMSQRGISFIWPLTSLSFVLTTFAAAFYLREEVSGIRWSGVILIVLGAGLITWSEKVREAKEKEASSVEQLK